MAKPPVPLEFVQKCAHAREGLRLKCTGARARARVSVRKSNSRRARVPMSESRTCKGSRSGRSAMIENQTNARQQTHPSQPCLDKWLTVPFCLEHGFAKVGSRIISWDIVKLNLAEKVLVFGFAAFVAIAGLATLIVDQEAMPPYVELELDRRTLTYAHEHCILKKQFDPARFDPWRADTVRRDTMGAMRPLPTPDQVCQRSHGFAGVPVPMWRLVLFGERAPSRWNEKGQWLY